MSTLKSQLKADPEIKALDAVVATAIKSFSPEKVLREAEHLHLERKSRKLYKVVMAPTPLYTADMQDLSTRARLVELKTGIMRMIGVINAAVKSVKTHVSTKYQTELREYGSTIAERNRIIDRVVSDAVQSSSDMASVVDILDVYIKDLDQAGYALRRAIDALKLAHGNRGQEEV